jgi:hypothetical protein
LEGCEFVLEESVFGVMGRGEALEVGGAGGELMYVLLEFVDFFEFLLIGLPEFLNLPFIIVNNPSPKLNLTGPVSFLQHFNLPVEHLHLSSLLLSPTLNTPRLVLNLYHVLGVLLL